jgi:hypothetical protein
MNLTGFGFYAMLFRYRQHVSGGNQMSAHEEAVTKEDLKRFKEGIAHEFHFISEGLGDQIKFVAEGHSVLVKRFDRMEKENERQHLEASSHQTALF